MIKRENVHFTLQNSYQRKKKISYQLVLSQVKYKESEENPLQTLPRVEFRNTHIKQHKLESLYSNGRSLNLPAGQKL